jgi:hypothetical protein
VLGDAFVFTVIVTAAPLDKDEGRSRKSASTAAPSVGSSKSAMPHNKGEDSDGPGIEELGTENVAMSSLLNYLHGYTSSMANIGISFQLQPA